MFKLMANENVKIYRRLRTWIMLGIVLLAIILIAVVLVTHQQPAGDWKPLLQAEDAHLQQQLSRVRHLPAQQIQQIKAQIQLNKYELAHNINPLRTTGWEFAAMAQNISTLLIAFVLVIAGDTVASEFSTGTIKMLLTQTATRSKILFAKYLSMLLFGLVATAFMFVCTVVVGWIFFGTRGALLPHFFINAHQAVQEMSSINFLLMQYGFLLIQMIMMATIAFMISAIFRSSALAITISLLAYVIGNTLVHALASYNWVKYILFANTDLTQYVVGGPQIKGLTLGFSITMLIAYFAVMIGLAWTVFLKRDVAYT